MREAEAAIQRYHNKDMGRNIRLLVKISESKKHREERKQMSKEEAEFSRTLHCAQSNLSFEHPESDEEAEKELSNPLQPRYVSSNSVGKPVSGSSSLNSSGGAPSGSETQTASPQGAGKAGVTQDSGKDHGLEGAAAPAKARKACKVCQKPAVTRCSRCKMAYCTEACQRDDWHRHQNECVSAESTKVEESSEIQIAEGSDDEGFVFDCPSAEDLVGIKQILHNAKTSEDLARLVADSIASKRLSGPGPESSVLSTPKQSAVGIPKGRGSRLFDISQSQSPKTSPPDTKASLQRSLCANPLPRDLGLSNLKPFSTPECFVPVKNIYSQLEQLRMPLLSLPPLSSPPMEFFAIVTFYSSPCEFNVIIPSVETKQALQFMHSLGPTRKRGDVSASQLSQGSKCGYSDAQGGFVRVVVHKVVSPTEILVTGYDFGGQYSVPATDLIHLPEELVLIPCLAHKCALKDVEVSEHGKANFVSAVLALKKLVNHCPVLVEHFGVRTGSIVCSIKTNDGSQNFIDSLLHSQFITRAASAQSGTFPAPTEGQRQIPLRLSYSASKVEYHRIQPGAVVVILPTVVINPSIIWAQVDHPYLNNMEAMNADLNLRYPPDDSSSNPYMPATGEMCVAKYSQDQKYYRAEVLRVHHNGMADIRFSETGRCDSVAVSQLYHINPYFLSLPRQARKFSLSGIEPNQSITWSDNAIAFLKDKILNRHVAVKVLSVASEEVLVDIFDPDLPNQLMNNSLILLGHAQISQSDKPMKLVPKATLRGVVTSETPSDYKYSDTLPQTSVTLQDSGPQTPPTVSRPDSAASDHSEHIHPPDTFQLSEGDFVEVSLSHMNTLERFYVQLVEPNHFSKVQAVLGKIFTTQLVPLPQRHIKKGALCLCLYSEDNEVHRAQVIGCKDNKVTVVFKDYGNVFHCTSDVVYKITEELLELPFQAIACSLNQVRNPAGTKKDWDLAALAHFQRLLESGPLKAKIVKVVGVLHVVDIKVTTSQGMTDVLKAMIDAGHVLARTREMHGTTQRRLSYSPQRKQQESDRSHAFSAKSAEKPLFGRKILEGDNTLKVLAQSTSSSLNLPPSTEYYQESGVSGKKVSAQSPSSSLNLPPSTEYYQESGVSGKKVSAQSPSSSLNLPPSTEYYQESGVSGKKVSAQSPSSSLNLPPSTEYYQESGVSGKKVSAQSLSSSLNLPPSTEYYQESGVSGKKVSAQSPSSILFLPPRTEYSGKNQESGVVSSKKASPQSPVARTSASPKKTEMVMKPKLGDVGLEKQFPSVASLQTIGFQKDSQSVNVIVTETVSLNEFYVQLITSESVSAMGKISEILECLSPGETSPTVLPPVNSLCCAKFSQDHMWYRCEVESLCELNNTVSVQYIDYGNRDEVHVSETVACPLECLSIPVIAVRCAFAGTSSMQVDEPKALEFMKKHTSTSTVTAQVVSLDEDIPSVNLKTENFDFVTEMTSQGILKAKKKVEVYPLVDSLEKMSLPSDLTNVKVVISEVVTPREVYIQIACNEVRDLLMKIGEGLNAVLTSDRSSPDEFPEVGSLCCAKFSADKHWYRAAILEMQGSTCLVQFVDYGNRESVFLKDILACPSDFYSFPFVAIRCGLAGLQCLQAAEVEKVTQYLHQHTAEFIFSPEISGDDNGITLLTLRNDTGATLLCELLALKVLGAKLEFPLANNVQRVQLPETEEFRMLLGEVHSPSKFYVQLATVENGHILRNITEGLNNGSAPLKLLDGLPDVGILCCARFSLDKQWYRAEILKINQENCEVFFVDYGNLDKVILSDLAFCPSQLSSLPLQAVECGLSGIPSVLKSGEKIVQHLQENLSDKLLVAKMEEKIDTIPQLRILKDGEDVLGELIKLSLFFPDNTPSISLVNDLKSVELPSDEFKAILTAVINPFKFFVQVASMETSTMIDRITQGINDKSHPLVPLSSPPIVGMLCCAKFSLYMQWYRAEITEVTAAKSKVFFLDYGNQDEVVNSDLAVCPEELATLPRIAVECGLNGLPTNTSSVEKSVSYLQNILNKLIFARVVVANERVPLIDITNESTNILLDILDSKDTAVMVKDMDCITLPSGPFKALVTEVVNSREIYIQVATPEVGSLEIRISELVNTAQAEGSFSSPPAMGSLCCAKFSSDMQWYRAEVKCVQEAEINVFFIDYGNSDVVSYSSLAPCPHELASLPRLASKCAIDGMSPELTSTEYVTKYLKQNLANVLVSVTVADVKENNVFLNIVKDGKNLLDEMSHHGILKSLTGHVFVKDMDCISLPATGLFQVIISEVVNHLEFYVQLVAQEVETMLSNIAERINNASSSLQTLSATPEIGVLCCAKFSDDRWYRAEVLETSVSEKIVVKFIDYGNVESNYRSDLASCPSELAKQPYAAIKCGLANLPASDVSASFSTILNKYLDTVLSARIVCEENNVPQLELLKGKSNVLEEMPLLKTSPDQSSVVVAKNMKHITLPSNIDFQVLVSEVVSPNIFYVQLATAEVGVVLKNVTEIINRESLPLKPFESLPSKGALCCAKFSEDQRWYRAEVLQVNGLSSCQVLFTDFGNTAIVPASDLAACPPECNDLPLIACQCRLSGFPLNTDVSAEVVELFKHLTSNTSSLLSAKLVVEMNGLFEVELFGMGDHILDKLLEHVPSTIESLPLVSSMERMQVPSIHKPCSVSVTGITSLNEVYVQFATQKVAMMLNDISDGLQEVFESNYCSLACPPVVGSLCCARYSVDSLWYRAKIQVVQDDKFTVQFLDYGNNDILPLSSLAACPSQFIDFPIIAVCCSIAGIQSDFVLSLDSAIRYLKEVTCDIETTLEIVDMINGIPQVSLSVEGTDVITLMKAKGLITAVSHLPANMEMLKFPSTSEHVKCLVYSISSFSEFYVHVNNNERSSVLCKIEEEIAAMFDEDSPKPLVVPPSVGYLCLAKFSDDSMWYRAKVESASGDELDVLYLDYRNLEKVHISNTVACPARLASLPQVAIRCGLHGLPSNLVPTGKLISTFTSLVTNNLLDGQHVCDIEGVPQIELVKDGKNIVRLLGLPEYAGPMFGDMKKLQLPSSGETFQLLVCEVRSPCELYVQVNNEATISAVKVVTENLKHTTDLAQLPSFPPAGSVCCAKFSQDEMWYRARVDSIADNTCKVFFFDFGNFEEVTLTKMAACPADLLNVPVVAVRCSLHGLESLTSQDWSSSAVSILKALTVDRLLNASVICNKLSDCPAVQLSDINNGTLLSVEFKNKCQPSGSTVVILRKCQVTEVNDPGSLYFQYLEADNANNLSLLNKLQEVYANPSTYSEFAPAVGSLCCARFSEDMKWYRCKILSITKESVQLSYIDFGSVESVPKNEVYRLDDVFSSPPPFALHVKIRGIGPRDSGSWSKGATNKLSDLCDKILFVSMVEQDGDIFSVDLFEDENRQSSIADILVSCGHAANI